MGDTGNMKLARCWKICLGINEDTSKGAADRGGLGIALMGQDNSAADNNANILSLSVSG